MRRVKPPTREESLDLNLSQEQAALQAVQAWCLHMQKPPWLLAALLGLPFEYLWT